jgi:hypothetical protein
MTRNSPSLPFHGHAPAACEWHEHFPAHGFGDMPFEEKSERKGALEGIKRRLESELSRVNAELKQLS